MINVKTTYANHMVTCDTSLGEVPGAKVGFILI